MNQPKRDSGASEPVDESRKQFVAFYSWPPDRMATRSFMRKALNNAVAAVTKDQPNYDVIVDEATRGLPSSPNIPVSIMDKIRAADMVRGSYK